MIHYWEVLVKYLDKFAVGLGRFKKPFQKKLCKLP